MSSSIMPIQRAIEAKPHRPVYRMHRYWARRPYSVFAELVRHYTKGGDVILDPFCGGGVTLVEGILQGRRVIGLDINPLAAFITKLELDGVDLDGLKNAQDKVISEYRSINNQWFTTTCRYCSASASALWFEYSALAVCDNCSITFRISEEKKSGSGRWVCPNCGHIQRFSPNAATKYELINVYYRCSECGHDEVAKASSSDLFLAQQIEKKFEHEKAKGLWLPTGAIPDCNMQRESALFKKGFFHFWQFFTPRHLLTLSLLREAIIRQDSPFQEWLLFAFSSTLRYTNRMVTRNEGWRGTRPLEWANPGFWLPPVHLEANVLEEFCRRCDAISRGKKDYLSKLPKHITPHQRPVNGLLGNNTCAFHVSCCSATKIPLPDKSIDVIITDPPYGSYVHYADLSNFWSVWLPEIDGLGKVLNEPDEAVISRKKFPGAKTTYEYQKILERCFSECSRVLKPNGYMVLTFHNREPRAWIALLVAAVKAGFELAPQGMLFQDGIASYRHTAQSRRSGSIIGDFILSFQKLSNEYENLEPVSSIDNPIQENDLIRITAKILNEKGALTPNALIAYLYAEFLPHRMGMVHTAIKNGNNAVDKLIEEFDKIRLFDSHRRELLEEHFRYEDGKWFVRETH